MKKLLTFSLIGALALFAAACGKSDSNPTASATNAPATPDNTNAAGHKTDDSIPAAVKAALPNAQSFTKQHKDITPAQKASIEKETGGTVPDSDHHSYLAFATEGGVRKQIGAATIVKAGGQEAVIVYENRNGSPYIKEVRAEGVAAFLDQFKGKGHDDKLAFGSAIKAQGADEATAKALTSAIAVDVQTMQALYGAAHTH